VSIISGARQQPPVLTLVLRASGWCLGPLAATAKAVLPCMQPINLLYWRRPQTEKEALISKDFAFSFSCFFGGESRTIFRRLLEDRQMQ